MSTKPEVIEGAGPAPDQTKEVARESLAVIERAKAIEITTPEQYEAAAEFLREEVKAARKKIAEVFDPMQKRAYDTHREIVAQRKKVEEPLQLAEDTVKRAISVYRAEVRRQQQEAERAALAEAQKRAEDEALERASRFEDRGEHARAEAELSRPVAVVPQVAAPAEPKAEGISTRPVWRFEITDPTKIDPKFMVPDEKKIGQTVRAMKGDAAAIIGEGVRVYCDEVVSARS